MMRITYKKPHTPQEIEKGNAEFLDMLRQELISGKVPKEFVRLTKAQVKEITERGEVDIPVEQLEDDEP